MTAEARIGVVSQPETGKMGGAPFRSPDAYRNMLAKAGVSPVDIDRSANGLPTTQTLGSEQTVTAVRLSKGVCLCAERARAMGITEEEIARIIEKATVAARGEHRTKVGLFGRAGEVIGELKAKITEGQRQAALKR